MRAGDRYYWAHGRQVPLERSDEVVVDGSEPALEGLAAQGRALSGSLVLVSESDATAALGEGCASMSGVHPVFRAEDGS